MLPECSADNLTCSSYTNVFRQTQHLTHMLLFIWLYRINHLKFDRGDTQRYWWKRVSKYIGAIKLQ